MIVFLIKIRASTPFAWLDPVVVEPLELAYLSAAARNAGATSYIWDDFFDLHPPSLTPDVIVLTGYNTAENRMIRVSQELKEKYPGARLIIGGVHAQCNPGVFHVPSADCVFHSQDLEQFCRLLGWFGRNLESPGSLPVPDLPEPLGFDFNTGGSWFSGQPRFINGPPAFLPDRSLTATLIDRTRYIDKEKVTLLKSRVGCPYRCDFCYCRMLNGGHHLKPDIELLLDEALALSAENVWIVDDVFLATREDAMAFLNAAAKREPYRLNLIVYLRADLILRIGDLLGPLRDYGVREVIVGFEAVTPNELENYRKQTDALDYPEAIRLLRGHSIDLTALFMVSPDYRLRDFRRLARFIRTNALEIWTISILTPLKGTRGYEEARENLLTEDPVRFDFLHLVLPSHIPKAVYYLLFAWLHAGLFRSRRIRKMIGLRLRNLFFSKTMKN